MSFTSACFYRLSICFVLLLLALPITSRAAQDKVGLQQLSLLDRTHQEISQRLINSSRWFDSFFRDPRSDEETAGTLVRLRGSLTDTEGDGLHLNGQFKALVNLPNLERRFHLILSSQDDNVRDETLTDIWTNRELTHAKTNTTLALRYTQKRSSTLSLTHQVGFGFNNGPNPKVRSRIRYTLPVAKQSLLSLTQAVFWERHDGFGEESRIDLDLSWSENKILRATGQGLYSETSQGYEWLTMLQWLMSFNDKSALSIGAFTAGETRPQNQLTEYHSFIKYRQNFIKKWLFFELEPEVYWLRDNDFKATSAFTLTLEVQFGK